MFTGIIEELGTVRSIKRGPNAVRLGIAAGQIVGDAAIGDSISVNGVCLTAVELDQQGFTVDVIPESLARSSLGSLEPGSRVNLERPLRLGGRLDGHIVQGHVDDVADVIDGVHEGDGGYRLKIDLSLDLVPYVVEKGSITVDGVSLTVAALDESSFEVALIPHTLTVTTLGDRRKGDLVNLEVDVIAKYVARNMDAYAATHQTIEDSE